MVQRAVIYLFCLPLLAGCTQSPTLPGFDAAAWRRDLHGCDGQRQAQLPTLYDQRESLYGTHVGAVAKLLGHPNEEELQEQSQRVYFYFVEPGAQCKPPLPSAARRLTIRFGSLGTVTEVLVSPGTSPTATR